MTHRILAVDDQPFFRHILATTLRQTGYPIDTAADEHEALDKITKSHAVGSPNTYIAVVTDRNMDSQTGGDQLIRGMRELELQHKAPAAAAVMVSADKEAASALSKLPGDNNAFLPKGHSPKELVDLLNAGIKRTRFKHAQKDKLLIPRERIEGFATKA